MRTVDPVRHSAKRRHIIDTAAGCFAVKGFERTTVAEICTAAGISTGSLFHYFPSKKAIFRAIFEQDGLDNARVLSSASGWAGVLSVIDHLVAPLADRAVAGLVVELVAQAGRDPSLAALVVQNELALRDGLATLLSSCDIDPSVPPVTAASWIQGLVDGLYSRTSLDPSFDPAEQVPVLKQIVTRFLRPTS
ncbi:hypothetical protein Lesp02_16160 [Lentzea sp. NBRC 105346]|uniref:TetR/AcrR family transcriptional regulator n=1 Tax=Lentzea sp. NBRC 105346 TaxID=3032205 RepID=UPI0024A3A232|nr:TetR/AcrR family transcriptional regulator [Lentzea sp. NBRC 105346]GLZ29426.1 hypothetical protein Lesp02_16160 [Lentzea sp. NBRC 105346]